MSFEKTKDAIKASQEKQKTTADKHSRPLNSRKMTGSCLNFPRLAYDKPREKIWQGMHSGHQKYYAKLARRYYGSFQILERINETAYRLKFPTHWHIHNAFQVSLLKDYKGTPPKEPIMEDPPEFDEIEKILQRECILMHEDKLL